VSFYLFLFVTELLRCKGADTFKDGCYIISGNIYIIHTFLKKLKERLKRVQKQTPLPKKQIPNPLNQGIAFEFGIWNFSPR